MRKSQIVGLENRTIEENQNFLRELYKSDLVETMKWFDKLDCSVSIARQPDDNMTLESFLDLMINKKYFAILQMGSPSDGIRYCVRILDKQDNKFAWIECPFMEKNYEIIAKLFKQIFKEDMEQAESFL